LEPYLENWLANKPGNVRFKRVPAVINPAWRPQARAFYTAKALGILDEIHKPIFDEIHDKHHFLRDKRDFQQFFAQYGIDKEQFEEAWNSPSVETGLQRAAVLGERYRVTAVPMVVVGGMYSTEAAEAHDFARLINMINFLIDKRLEDKE
jgi:thiol:disulfide interchange protein DsbA